MNSGAQGLVVIVTGGGRGIGRAIVRAALARGYAVGFTYVSDDAAADALVDEATAGGGQILALKGDVADPEFARTCFDRVVRELGPVAALVNNAGITGGIGSFATTSQETIRRSTEVNLLGTMWMAQEAVRRWSERAQAGRMVNMSSVAASLGAPGEYVHYAAAKAGVEGFTIGLGKEVAPLGIRVNAVSPGTTYTDIHAAGGEPDRPARVVGRVPIGRIAEPEEIASAVLWLLSDEASYVTGTVLRSAGGL